jgi:glycosyltransferase involved in cell wall biosynthesis
VIVGVTFSVVIPCYNYAHVVERAIESVFAQGEDGFDVTAINDGSTDTSGEVLERCARARGTRLRVIHQENRGLSAVRNRGTSETCGDYLIFLDADDELMPDALAHFRSAIDAADKRVHRWRLSLDASGGGLEASPSTAAPPLREARFALSERDEDRGSGDRDTPRRGH